MSDATGMVIRMMRMTSRDAILYKFAELTNEDLQVVAKRYPYWSPIINSWDELCLMYENKCWRAMGDAFSCMTDEIMTIENDNENN